MPVNGFSVEHDYEVQAYRAARNIYLAAEKRRKQQEKAQKKISEAQRRASITNSGQGVASDDAGLLKTLKALVYRRRVSKLEQEPRLLQGVGFEFSDSDSDEISLKKALG